MTTYSLLLIATFKRGLSDWKKSGLYDREIGYYKKVQGHMRSFGIFTYDTQNEMPAGELYSYYYNSHKLPAALFSLLWPFLHIKELAKYDVVKTNQFAGAWVGTIIKMIRKDKVRFVLRGGYAWRYKGIGTYISDALMRISMRYADLIVFVSDIDREEYLQVYGDEHRHKCVILPNSVDTDLFRPLQKGAGGVARIVLIGRLVAMKNFQSALRAIADLPEGMRRRTQVQIVGEGDYEQELRRIAEEKNVPCTFLGALPNNDIANIVGHADIYIMPQMYGSGISKGILEAMAAGAIVIASDIEAHRNTLTDGVDGLLCGTQSDSIREKLAYVLAGLDSPKMKDLRTRATERIRLGYSMDAVSKKEAELVSSLVAKK